MDLIYMDNEMHEQGVLPFYSFDLAFGADENDFECMISSSQHCCQAGWYLFIDGTEYGGIIDSLEVRSDTEVVIYKGRTWHGMLGSRIVMPLTSSDSSTADVIVKTVDSNSASLVDRYLIISGDANRCIDFLLTRMGLSDLFEAPEAAAGAIVHEFQFDRFTDGYSGIVKMLGSIGQKLKIEYSNGNVIVSGVDRYDYSTSEEFDASMVDMRIKKKSNAVNHLICLGSGELDQRTVIHLYCDESGNISTVQTQTGLNEYAATYDRPNIESDEDLLTEGTEKLSSLWEPDEMVINLDDSSDYFGIGDKVGATDSITGLSSSATIKKKIVKLDGNATNISYEVGE